MSQGPRRRRRHTRRRRGRVAAAAGVAGETALTVGVLVLLYVVYVLWGTGLQTDRAQDELREQTITQWRNPGSPDTDDPDEAQPGDGYAVLRIPRLGEDWEWVVVQGVNLSDLARGPGHYDDTANSGELGNFSIAGHRAGHGAPFADMDTIQVGDIVEVDTAASTWTYTIDQAPRIIDPIDTWVVDPVPGEGPEVEPTERRITLTTCHPRYGSSQRMYVTGLLTSGEAI